MKFENPKINISMFEMESVATQASTNFDAAIENATGVVNTYLESQNKAAAANQVLSFRFD